MLLAPEERAEHDAQPPRSGDPPLLDRSLQSEPRRQRSFRQVIGHAIDHEHLDPGRLQGPAVRPLRPAPAPDRGAGRGDRNPDPPRDPPGRRGGKLFGIGAESYTVGSNEFYLAYATSRKIMLCLDTGHFHPT